MIFYLMAKVAKNITLKLYMFCRDYLIYSNIIRPHAFIEYFADGSFKMITVFSDEKFRINLYIIILQFN